MKSKSLTELTQAYQQKTLPLIFQKALESFLKKFGMRSVWEIDLGRPRWREDPAAIFQSLSNYLKLEEPCFSSDTAFQSKAFRAKEQAMELTKLIRKTKNGVLRAKRFGWEFERLRVLGGLREFPRFYLIRLLDQYRTFFLEKGEALAAAGKLKTSTDIFFLTLAALKQQEADQDMDLKTMVLENQNHFKKECLRKLIPLVMLSNGEAYYNESRSVGDKILKGHGVSPGVVEGRVRILSSPVSEPLKPGEILVCSSTDPGWTPLFLTAAGLVMEIGGVLSHGSIIAREFGLPAIVSVQSATTRLKTGQLIRLDGTQGKITILENF